MILLFGILSQPTIAAWPQPRADAQRTGTTSPIPSGEGTVHWASDLPTNSTAPPVVSPEHVLVVAEGVHALNRSTGDTAWTFEPWPELGFNGIGAPVTDGDVTVVATMYPSLHAVDVENGTERWSREPSSIPRDRTIGEDRLFTGRAHNVTARQLATGNVAWDTGFDGEVHGLTLAGDRVFVALGNETARTGRLVALDADTGRGAWSTPTAKPLVADPAVGPSTVVAGGFARPSENAAGLLLAVKRSDGEPRWQADEHLPFVDDVAIEGGTVLATPEGLGGESYLVARDRASGDERWFVGDAEGPVVVTPETVLAAGERLEGRSVDTGVRERSFPVPGSAAWIAGGHQRLYAATGETVYALDGGRPVDENQSASSPPAETAAPGLATWIGLGGGALLAWRGRGAS
jgi:outer membrane protein assembly factor BamB